MSATIRKAAGEIREEWQELWLAMADGDISQYGIIKGLDVHEFWGVLKQWKKRVQAKLDAIKNK